MNEPKATALTRALIVIRDMHWDQKEKAPYKNYKRRIIAVIDKALED